MLKLKRRSGVGGLSLMTIYVLFIH
ncbi:hypothetical protein GBAR_LOCUS24902 [Geodia barretti]|uniref:Uncharacterized protein n=1 Tax=Geodia barretti TaxID=519541 RepID=A0AA35XA44_GEOBA|nr:hypothetical protein GBAR_LOCUS24902 [Geodia barretti]